MPPKKVVVEEKIPLGRPGNNLKSGIVRRKRRHHRSRRHREMTAVQISIQETSANQFQVGLANVGKSTLFQAITKCNLGNPAVC